jgi:hypothetical protein
MTTKPCDVIMHKVYLIVLFFCRDCRFIGKYRSIQFQFRSFREASHIDFVHEIESHMFVFLETPPPPLLRNVAHSYRYFVLIVHIR